MELFIETISVEGGRIPLAPYHLRRVRETLGGAPSFLSSPADLDRIARALRPGPGQYKLRLLYSREGIEDASLAPYSFDIGRVRHLRPLLIPADYRYDRKYADRQLLDRVAASLPDSQTVALLVQEGRVTDTTFTNVCFRECAGGEWVTPSRPLLRGTRRQQYLDEGRIRPAEVTLEALLAGRWSEAALINALNPLGRCILPLSALEV